MVTRGPRGPEALCVDWQVWTGIVSLNTFAMVLVFFFFPETLHKNLRGEFLGMSGEK